MAVQDQQTNDQLPPDVRIVMTMTSHEWFNKSQEYNVFPRLMLTYCHDSQLSVILPMESWGKYFNKVCLLFPCTVSGMLYVGQLCT